MSMSSAALSRTISLLLALQAAHRLTSAGSLPDSLAAAAILAGVPEALAVIVAIKGIGRFTELDAAEARERFIIGTLVSLSWAGACGALAYLAVR